jgi:tetratricopeptide (TPR) repeat protein
LTVLAAGVFWAQHWAREREQRDWREAEEALQVFDLNRAARALERHLQRHPEDAEGWFLAARTSRRLDRIPEAETYLKRAEDRAGDPERIRLERDLIQVQRGNLGEIDRRLRGTIGPDHPGALFVLEALARGYLRRERLADCIQACDLWRASQPEHPWPRLFRGLAFEQQGHMDRAEAEYRAAVALAPGDRAAHLAFGRFLVGQRRAPEAAPHFQQILAQSGEDVAGLIGAASCLIEQGRSAEAAPLLDRAEALAPPATEATILRAKIALSGDRYAQAEALLRGVARQAPDDREALHLLGQTLLAQGKTTEAETIMALGKRQEADLLRLKELVQTMARYPGDPHPRYEAGVIALRLGRVEQGRYWLEEALRVRPGHAPSLAALAERGWGAGSAQALEDGRH